MSFTTLKKHIPANLSPLALWLGVAVFTAARLALCSQQMFYTWVDGAPLDDELVFSWAQSIAAGQWLGEYSWLTLSKAPFFAIWLAAIHCLGLPYLIAGQLLWCAASLAAMGAFLPKLKNRWQQLGLYALLCFNPAACAGFTWRVYRDNIYPALCLLAVTGLVGWLLRCGRQNGPSLWFWPVLAGLGMGCGVLCREDGVWVLPFGVLAALAGLAVLVLQKAPRKRLLAGLAGAVLPFVLAGGCVAAVCGINYVYYGVFAVSDFSSGSFSDAIGAMTRVKETTVVDTVSIPTEVRELLYEQVPEAKELEQWLEEDDDLQNSYRNPALDDYRSGSFYWAVRKAAMLNGEYETPQKAQAYWAALAEEINRQCDSGELPSEGGKRSGTTPPITLHYVPAALAESVKSLFTVLTFGGCSPVFGERTIGTTEDLAVWESFLHMRCNVAAAAGTDQAYYNPLQKAAFALLEAIRWAYAIGLLAGFVLGMWAWFKGMALLIRRKLSSGLAGFWLLLGGLLAMAALRIGIMAYMEVASFRIGTSAMYLASVHPLLLLFAFMAALFARELKAHKEGA